jgi:hypothetical protein
MNELQATSTRITVQKLLQESLQTFQAVINVAFNVLSSLEKLVLHVLARRIPFLADLSAQRIECLGKVLMVDQVAGHCLRIIGDCSFLILI